MTDEDFEELDDDFGDEFDFVEDVKEESSADTGAPKSPKQPGHSNMIKYSAIAAVVLVGGYYAMGMLFGGDEPKQQASTEKTSLPVPVETVVAVEEQNVPEPTESMGSTDSIDDMAVDFAESFDQPAPPELTEALPVTKPTGQTKSFEQVQKSLQPAKMQIPDEINATLDSISEEMTLNVNQIKQLETTINSLANTVGQLNRSISAMDNRVLGLTETVDALSQDLTNVKRVIIDEDLDLTSAATVRFSSKQQSQTQNITSTAPGYSVHAIIPGRAWLKSSSGQVITVREGDKVGDYGTVAVIDAANGLVRTSSGITFR